MPTEQSQRKTPYDYQFNIFSGEGVDKVIVFQAHLSSQSKNNYTISKISPFGSAKVYESLFKNIVNGKFKTKILIQQKIEIGDYDNAFEYLHINLGNAFDNIQKYVEIFGVNDETIEFTNKQQRSILVVTYDGPEYNIGCGLDFKTATLLNSYSDKIMTIASNDSSGFGQIFQGNYYAGSTQVPYTTDSYNEQTLLAFESMIKDIDDNGFDSSQYHNNKIYRDFILHIVKIGNSLKDLTKFAISVLGNTAITINLNTLKKEVNLYGNTVEIVGTKRNQINRMKNKNMYVLTIVDSNGHDNYIHFHGNSEYYDRIYRLSEEQIVTVTGTQKGEKTYTLTSIIE